ncbi:hypothetical protein BDW22DRAFT_1433054 [Trametopsis cervina]|nr:hypothetical protein BDW22DRAFT_1433054 [Trametopsis cervina]
MLSLVITTADMGWSDSEKDHLWQVVADPVVVAMYARNPGRVLDTDADGSVVQRARGRPSGVKGSVLKDIVAYALPGYLKKFSDPLAGESHTEFVEREKARRRHSLKTKRMVEETEADRLLRLEPVKLNQRLYTFFQNASPNKVAQRKPGRLTMPPAQQPLDRPLTPYEVFKSSGVVSAPNTSSASASSDRFRIADWNVAVKTHFNNLSAEEMAALEETTRERNEGHHADLPPALLKLTREKKVDDLPKMIRAAWDHWTGETDFRAITIYGGVGKDDEVETNILHNIEDSEGRSFVQFFCERLNLPTERFRLVLEMFFQNVYKPIAYPDERTSEQPEGVEGASEGNLEVDIDMALPMSDVRSEANTAVPQLSTEDDMDDIRSELSYLDVSELAQVTKGAETVHAMSGVRSEAHVAEPQFSADGDMDDTRSELSYVDISELTRLAMDVEAVHGIADDRPDMDVESEDPMSLVVDPVDASAHSAQVTVEAVPISSGLEAGGADSNLEGPAPGVPEGESHTRMLLC